MTWPLLSPTEPLRNPCVVLLHMAHMCTYVHIYLQVFSWAGVKLWNSCKRFEQISAKDGVKIRKCKYITSTGVYGCLISRHIAYESAGPAIIQSRWVILHGFRRIWFLGCLLSNLHRLHNLVSQLSHWALFRLLSRLLPPTHTWWMTGSRHRLLRPACSRSGGDSHVSGSSNHSWAAVGDTTTMVVEESTFQQRCSGLGARRVR